MSLGKLTCSEQNTMNESFDGRFPLKSNDFNPMRVSEILNILKLVIKLSLISSEVKVDRSGLEFNDDSCW